MTPETATMEQQPTTPGEGGFWRLVREALRGERQDYTREPLRRAILLLAVPMVLEMIMESVFAVVDIFWVSQAGRRRRRPRSG